MRPIDSAKLQRVSCRRWHAAARWMPLIENYCCITGVLRSCSAGSSDCQHVQRLLSFAKRFTGHKRHAACEAATELAERESKKLNDTKSGVAKQQVGRVLPCDSKPTRPGVLEFTRSPYRAALQTA